MKKILSALLFLGLFSILVFGQKTTTTPPPVLEDDNVVKISTNLIQLDVVVTDGKGNQVKDLNTSDFEISENGAAQDITNFSYVDIAPENQTPDALKAASKAANKLSVPIPTVKLKPEQVRRTYAIVVDDLGISFENVSLVQYSLRKLINEQVQNNDLVAIVRTGSGFGTLQSFTSDKNQLLAAVNKIRWNPQGRSGISSFGAISPDFKEDLAGTMKITGERSNPAGAAEDKEFQDQINEFRNENFSVGTLGALNYIIGGMRELPGRKSLLVISEGLPLISKGNGMPRVNRVLNALKVLADLANRASVVVYTLDPRGLQMPGMATAADDIPEVIPMNFDPANSADARSARESDFQDTQHSLRYLAYETGGLPYVNQNDLSYGLRKALNDQKGYYLIGYEPDSETFDPKKNKYNRLVVKVKRPGLKVRYRSGFFGVSDEKMTQVKQSKQQQIYTALTSPFGSSGVNLNLYVVGGNDAKSGNFIRSLVYIDGKDLNFTREANGTRKANFDIIAMTFGDNGVPVDQTAKNYTIQASEEVYRKILDKGFVYNLPVLIKKPGAYQFRVALRDSTTEKIGSVSQFVEVPDIKKKLSISKLILTGFTPEEWQKISLGQAEHPAAQNNSQDAFSNMVMRKFKRGTVLHYDGVIYNAKPESIKKSQLQIQIRLFRQSNLLFESKPSPFNTTGQTDLQRIDTSGTITLGKNIAPGNYIVQMVIFENASQTKPKITTQFVEFEIVE